MADENYGFTGNPGEMYVLPGEGVGERADTGLTVPTDNSFTDPVTGAPVNTAPGTPGIGWGMPGNWGTFLTDLQRGTGGYADILKSIFGGKYGDFTQMAAFGGIAALLNRMMSQSPEPVGYQGSIPQYTATRTQLPVPYSSTDQARLNQAIQDSLAQGFSLADVKKGAERRYGVSPAEIESAIAAKPAPYRRPGAGGITYFSPMQYSQVAPPAPAPVPAPQVTPPMDPQSAGDMKRGIASVAPRIADSSMPAAPIPPGPVSPPMMTIMPVQGGMSGALSAARPGAAAGLSPSQTMLFNKLRGMPGQGSDEDLMNYAAGLSDYQALASLASVTGETKGLKNWATERGYDLAQELANQYGITGDITMGSGVRIPAEPPMMTIRPPVRPTTGMPSAPIPPGPVSPPMKTIMPVTGGISTLVPTQASTPGGGVATIPTTTSTTAPTTGTGTGTTGGTTGTTTKPSSLSDRQAAAVAAFNAAKAAGKRDATAELGKFGLTAQEIADAANKSLGMNVDAYGVQQALSIYGVKPAGPVITNPLYSGIAANKVGAVDQAVKDRQAQLFAALQAGTITQAQYSDAVKKVSEYARQSILNPQKPKSTSVEYLYEDSKIPESLKNLGVTANALNVLSKTIGVGGTITQQLLSSAKSPEEVIGYINALDPKLVASVDPKELRNAVMYLSGASGSTEKLEGPSLASSGISATADGRLFDVVTGKQVGWSPGSIGDLTGQAIDTGWTYGRGPGKGGGKGGTGSTAPTTTAPTMSTPMSAPGSFISSGPTGNVYAPNPAPLPPGVSSPSLEDSLAAVAAYNYENSPAGKQANDDLIAEARQIIAQRGLSVPPSGISTAPRIADETGRAPPMSPAPMSFFGDGMKTIMPVTSGQSASMPAAPMSPEPWFNPPPITTPTMGIPTPVSQRRLTGLAGGGYMPGGIAMLAGGRYLRGPGDGVSDSIPAKFERSGQPARLADGEFVIDARTVSEIGNGSSEAGARKLYAMMDRVHAARKKAKRGKPSGADKYLPK